MRPTIAAVLIVGAWFATACGAPGTYCQSGPKYGTQCYPGGYVQDPPGQTPARRDHEPGR